MNPEREQRALVGADDDCRARPDWSDSAVEQLVFELSFELEEAALSAADYVTVNRAKLRTIAKRVLARHRLAFAAEQDWQPIESAPRDGFFMVWSPSHPEVPMPVRASIYHDAMARERKGGQPAHLSFGHFTHWRPLPGPPAIPTAKEDGHER